MLYQVEGIVIRTMDYKETDKIITIFCREYGKLSFVANGVKRVKSRYGAACQLFSHGSFAIYMSKNLGSLRHAEVIHSFYDVRADLNRAAYAAYFTELLELMINEKEADERLFLSYHAGLQALESGQEPRILIHLFELRMLQTTGYAPQWRACVSCGQSESPFVLSAKAGGVICNRCLHGDPTARPVAEVIRRLLITMQQMEIIHLGAVELSDTTLQQLHQMIRYMMDYHVDHRWKSRSFLDQWQSLN